MIQKNTASARSRRSPWAWIPTLYFAEGLPNVIVVAIAVIMYKRLGMSNEDCAFYTSWLYLPWVIKPFWSPIVDMFRTKRWWILTMQLLIGASLAGVAFTLPGPNFVQWTLAFFWLMAFSSATHDIAADGFYMLELDKHEQALYVGIRSTFYRISTIAGQFLIIGFAGIVEAYTRIPVKAWSITMAVTAVIFLLLFFLHTRFLPKPCNDHARGGSYTDPVEFFRIFIDFFRKTHILEAIAFMLLYRMPEALLSKITPLFLIDEPANGGLGLSTPELSIVQGLGVAGLLSGGILGGIAVGRHGFKRWIWPMALSISLPNAVYIFMAYFQPQQLWLIIGLVNLEQLGYGFGFTAYMLYLIHFSSGTNQTAHYAFCTGFMALSMMLPGLVAGTLQEEYGYLNFFNLVMALIPVTFLVTRLINVPDRFGAKDEHDTQVETGANPGHTQQLIGRALRIATLVIAVALIAFLIYRQLRVTP